MYGSFSRVPVVRTLLDELTAAKWLERHEGAPSLPESGFTFVGHNTTLVRDGGASVLVDPYFRPMSAIDLPTYPPMHARDLGHVDAVCITHSHGDHFHLGSLLTLPRDTAIFVPPTERESLFSTDCVTRLTQVGFTNVHALPWFSSRKVGALSVHALPFYGEQPTSGEGVYPGFFNEGSTWVLRGPSTSAAFFADSGDDVRGRMSRRLRAGDAGWADRRALLWRARLPARANLLRLHDALGPYLVNVPLNVLITKQQLMASPREALDYAKQLEAKTLVPCADGGAPCIGAKAWARSTPAIPARPSMAPRRRKRTSTLIRSPSAC